MNRSPPLSLPSTSPKDASPRVDAKLTGLRSELYAAYSPLSLKAWLLFVQDCKVITVTRARAVRIFEAGLAEHDFVQEALAKRCQYEESTFKPLADSSSASPCTNELALVPSYPYILIDSDDENDNDHDNAHENNDISVNDDADDDDDDDDEEERKEEDFDDDNSIENEAASWMQNGNQTSPNHETQLQATHTVTAPKRTPENPQTDVLVDEEHLKCAESKLVLREESVTTLSFEAFGFCVHKLAHLAYEHDAKPCQTFSYLHLLPMVARRQVGFHLISFAEPPILRWLANPDTKAGLAALFLSYAPRGHLGFSDLRRMLRNLDVFPEYVPFVAVQDAFYETLQECTWEDTFCNVSLQSQVFNRTLDLPTFTECFMRIMVKSDLFSKASSGPEDLVPLLDRFLFPRRYLRNTRAKKKHTSILQQRKLTLSARKASPAPPKHRAASSKLKSHDSSQSQTADGADAPGATNAFDYFRDVCRERRRRKVAQLEVLEYIHNFAVLVKRGLGWPGIASQLHFGRRRALRASGILTTSSGESATSFKAPVSLREVETVRKAVVNVARDYDPGPDESKSSSADAESSSYEPPLASSSSSGHTSSLDKKKTKLKATPTGFVSKEEHDVVLTKLKALEDALDLGDMDDLDWDGTLDDAEAKMKDLVPLMMSEDPAESAAASNKFEMLDKIVRNHKDFKEREARQKQEWEDKNREINQTALDELRAIFPECIAQGTAMKDLRETFKLSAALAKRVFQRKALRLIHMSHEEIARMHIADLSGTFSTQGLDLREVRAVYASLPEEFASDSDGKKAGWREGVLNTLQDMNKKLENGSLPKAHQRNPAYDAPLNPPESAASPAQAPAISTNPLAAAAAAAALAAAGVPAAAGKGGAKGGKNPLGLSLAAAVAAKAKARSDPSSGEDAATCRRQGVNSQDFFAELRRRASVIGACRPEASASSDKTPSGSPVSLTKIARGLKVNDSDMDGADIEEVKQGAPGESSSAKRRSTVSSVSQLIKQCAKQNASARNLTVSDEHEATCGTDGHDEDSVPANEAEDTVEKKESNEDGGGEGSLFMELEQHEQAGGEAATRELDQNSVTSTSATSLVDVMNMEDTSSDVDVLGNDSLDRSDEEADVGGKMTVNAEKRGTAGAIDNNNNDDVNDDNLSGDSDEVLDLGLESSTNVGTSKSSKSNSYDRADQYQNAASSVDLETSDTAPLLGGSASGAAKQSGPKGWYGSNGDSVQIRVNPPPELEGGEESDGRNKDKKKKKKRAKSTPKDESLREIHKRRAKIRRRVKLLAGISMFANVCLFSFKIYVSVASRSLAVMASAVDSFLDLVSQTIIYYAMRGTRHVDEEKYPVGRNRLEPIGIIVCASLMGIAGLQLVWESGHTIIRGTIGGEDAASLVPATDRFTVELLGTAILVKLCLFVVCHAYRDESDSMMVLAEDHRNDILSNGIALATAFLANKYVNLWWLDPVGGILIAIYICYMWAQVAKEQAEMLEGVAADPEFLEQVRHLADSFHERMYVDVVRAYHFGKHYLVEVEVVLPGTMVVYDAHDISLDLQKRIESLERVERAFVHVDYMARDEDEHKAAYYVTPQTTPAGGYSSDEDSATSSIVDIEEQVEVVGDIYSKANPPGLPPGTYKRHVVVRHQKHHHRHSDGSHSTTCDVKVDQEPTGAEAEALLASASKKNDDQQHRHHHRHHRRHASASPRLKETIKAKHENVQALSRTGGGYGHVAVDYELRYGTAGPEDVSPTATYTSLQRLDFLPGVVSLTFHISIHDDAVLEDDEHFDLLLLNPRSIDDPSIPVSLGPQHQAQVTIHDDDFWYADAQSSILYHPTWVAQAGDTFSFAVFLRTSTGLALEDALPSSVKLVAQITDSVPAKPGTPMLECAHLAADEYICTHPVGPVLKYHTIATLAKAGGLVAEFYDVPFIESADPFLRRVDTVLDFIWGHGPIALTARDYVTVRWHGAIALPASATSTAVQLRVLANDRARVTLDGIVVLDDWDHGPLGTAATVTVELIQGNLHHIQVDYRELDGSAHLQLLWSIDGANFEVVPPSALYQLLPLPDMNTTILTADVDAASTFATGSCLETSIAGDPCVFFIHPRDAYTNGDPNITQDVFFEATVTLETASVPGNTLLPGNSVVLGTINATEDVPSTLQVVIDPIAAGTHTLEITVGNVHIAGSPFLLQVEPTHPHGPSFDVSGSGTETAPVSTHVVGDLKSVNLVLRDPYGNRIEEDLSALISIQVVHASAPGEVVTADISYLGSSEYLATYTVTRADQVNVQATIGCNQFGASVPCEHIAASPYALIFMHAASSAEHTFASGAGTAGATSGIEASVIVHLRDEFGNKVDTTPEAAASLSLRLVFDDGTFEDFVGVCVHQAEDLFSCPYTPARAEEQASLFIYLGGVAINEANAYTVDVSDGSCDAAQSFSSGVGNAYAVAGDITYFTVESHDAAGNPRVGPCADGITFRTDLAFYVDTTPPADGEPGIYTLSYNATLAGLASIAVYMVDATDTPIGTIMDSPLNVTVGPNSVEHARAIIRGAGLTQGVAGALHPVSIQAVDAFGNNLTQNGDVKFRVTHVEEDIDFMAGDLDQGLYNGSYVPFVAQNGTLQISVTQPGGIDAAYYRTRFFGSEPVEKVEQSLAFVWDDYASWDEDPLLENSAAWGARMFGLLKAPALGAVPSAIEYDLRTAHLENGMVRLGFRLRIDGGGARLWVNGKLLVDQWPEADVGITAWAQLPSQVPALAFLPIQLDFARDSSHPTAALSLEWATFDRAGQLASTPEQVPDEALYRWREISTFYPITVPAAAHPEASYVVDWTPLENLVAGVETIFEVQVTDAFGNDVFTHDDLVQVYGWSVPDLRGVDDGLDPDGMLVSASIVADPEERGGRFQIALTPTASGEFIVFIAVNTPEMHADLGRSELLEQLRLYQVADAPRRLSVRPGAISAVECSVSGSEVSANIAGEQGVFYVQVRDVSGNRREDENDVQAITVYEDARWGGNVTYQSHGLFQVTYTMLSAGVWNITIELSDGSSIAPFEIVVSPAEAFAATTSTSVVGDAAALTSPLQISITARDAFGNVLDRGGDRFVLYAELQDAFTPQLVLGETPANDLRPFRFGAPWVDFLQSTVDHTNGTYTMTLDFGTLEGSFLLHVELASGTGLLGSFFASPAALEGELALASDVLVQNAGSLQTIAATRAHYAGYVWVEHTANYSFALATDAEVGNDLEDGDHSQEQVISVGYVPLSQNESFRLRGDRVYPLAIKTWARPPFRLHLEWETALGADAAAAQPEQELTGHAQVTKYSQTFILSSDLSGQLGEGDKVRVRDEVFTVTAFDETRQILHVDLPYGDVYGGQAFRMRTFIRVPLQ
ncbi:Metal tolerance protein 9 [Hondaea fermentalgiana]|uniref:Metal tolerance protein 9 n=1 Tax=Hondaea fermentalgiana TaxID=2315210 RepID=A0A2R5GDS4_9STRA|nr:Metal tolerance protein 9 [Hondaea fermentalgiana]|eukprot:GBG28725.1 Metal tolerance protein 9 [Hondaea fermentalgiana]